MSVGASEEVRARVARQLDQAWRESALLQRFAGYLAFALLAIGVLPMVIGDPGRVLRNAWWLVVGCVAVGVLLLVGIWRLRMRPLFWGRVLYWPVRPLVWLALGGNPAMILVAVNRSRDRHRDAYDLLLRVPHWLKLYPDLPEARRWGPQPRTPLPTQLPAPPSPLDPRDEEFPRA